MSLAALVLLAAALGTAPAADLQKIGLRIDPAAGTIAGTSEIRLGAPGRLPITLRLDPGFAISRVAGESPAGATIPLSAEREGNRWRIVPAGDPEEVAALKLSWSGRPPLLDGASRPARPGAFALLPRGFRSAGRMFLPATAAWYPALEGERARFEVTVEVPEGWRVLGSGVAAEVAPAQDDGRTTFRFRTEQARRGFGLVAGTWEEVSRRQRGIRCRLAFDPGASRTGITASLEFFARLVERMTSSFGPHPWPEVTLVAAPFDIDSGTPGVLLLGADALEDPLAARERIARALAADWWGQGVFVAPGSGDWARPLALYTGAHEEAALRDPPADARLRREWRERHERLLAAGVERPLAEIGPEAGGAAGELNAVRGAMVFHMLRREVGDAAFREALRIFLAEHGRGEAGWADLRRAFERTSGRPLGWFFDQWVNRSGAPELRLLPVRARRPLEIRIQADGPWRLHVPVEVIGPEGQRVRREALLVDGRVRLRVGPPFPPRRVAVDPDADTLRRLEPGELPVLFGDLLEGGADLVVIGSGRGDVLAGAARAAAAVLAPGAPVTGDTSLDEEVLGRAHRVWLLGRPAPKAAGLFPLPAGARLGDRALAAAGVAASDEPALALATRTPDGRLLGFADALEPGALVRLVKMLDRYRWASWLLFERDRPRLARSGTPSAYPLVRDVEPEP